MNGLRDGWWWVGVRLVGWKRGWWKFVNVCKDVEQFVNVAGGWLGEWGWVGGCLGVG